MLRSVAAVVLAAAMACAAAPAAQRTPAIGRGVSIAGIRVGGLSSERARARVAAAFARPFRIVLGSDVTVVRPSSLGARADVDAAIAASFAATGGSRISLPVRFVRAKAVELAAALARRENRAPVAARLLGVSPAGIPLFRPERPGLAVDRAATEAAVERVLAGTARPTLRLPTRPVPARRTVARFGPVIVVTRALNSLRLYDGRRLVRTFRVATGQAIYPTPSGLWRIVVKQRDPWWYPPTYDSWAQGLKPVPPGPSNPLGTRWMGLNAPGVGIHGTDEPSSIGYSASHGCIRMQVPDAEWLFDHVRVGTPVVVL